MEGFDSELKCVACAALLGAAAVTTACHKRTGATSQKRERTESDVMRPPWAMREGSRAHRVHASRALAALAARHGARRDGDMERKAKNAMMPVENTMTPLQNCGEGKGAGEGEGEGEGGWREEDVSTAAGKMGRVSTHGDAPATVVQYVGQTVAAVVKELEADRPAVAVAPRWLLESGYGVLRAGPAPHDAAARNELRKNTVFGVEPEVFVLPEGDTGANMRGLVECNRDCGRCRKHEVRVIASEGERGQDGAAEEGGELAVARAVRMLDVTVAVRNSV
jgi:hypothetical protein